MCSLYIQRLLEVSLVVFCDEVFEKCSSPTENDGAISALVEVDLKVFDRDVIEQELDRVLPTRTVAPTAPPFRSHRASRRRVSVLNVVQDLEVRGCQMTAFLTIPST